MVIFFESQKRDPQRDGNATDEVVQKLILKRVSVQHLVLHTEVPSTKHRQERHSQPRRKHLITNNGQHREPVYSNNHGKRSPLTDFLQHGGCR